MRRNDSPSICFLGSAAYSDPLDATSRKKFLALGELGDIAVIGFGSDRLLHVFDEGARFYLVKYPRRKMFRYPARVLVGVALCLWRILRYRASIVVAQSPFDGLAGRCAKAIARVFGRRVTLVIENHADFELAPEMQSSEGMSPLYRRLLGFAAKTGIGGADAFRAVSSSTREQLAGMSSKPIFEFPAWTDIDAFFDAGPVAAEGSTRELVFAGILIPRKGVIHLIEALGGLHTDFPDVRLTLMGEETDKAYVNLLRSRIAELSLDEKVEFTGRLSQSQMAARMARSYAFVLPSYSEGLPRVLFEAMAVGLPSVATRVSGIPDILVDGTLGFLVDPGDEEALEEKLRWLLENPAESAAMGAAAREFLETFFSSARYVEGYREIFDVAPSLRT